MRTKMCINVGVLAHNLADFVAKIYIDEAQNQTRAV
jgi:hypothetical protein